MPPVDYRYVGLPRGPVTDHRRAPRVPVWRMILVAVVVMGAGAAPVMDPTATDAATRRCSVSASQERAPKFIRVRMAQTGHVRRVPFRLYVERVTASEWGSTPDALRRAGAIAVKQYGWSKALRPRRSGQGCFDVWNNTRDQIYRAKIVPERVRAAVAATWHVTLRHHGGRLVHTGYRTGSRVGCARDAGARLYARSAKRCANQGWSTNAILRTYYADRGVRVRRPNVLTDCDSVGSCSRNLRPARRFASATGPAPTSMAAKPIHSGIQSFVMNGRRLPLL